MTMLQHKPYLKSRTTEKVEVIGPKAMYLISINFRGFITYSFLHFYQNYMDFWPLTSDFYVESDF